jgi:hypothetical protein
MSITLITQILDMGDNQIYRRVAEMMQWWNTLLRKSF